MKTLAGYNKGCVCSSPAYDDIRGENDLAHGREHRLRLLYLHQGLMLLRYWGGCLVVWVHALAAHEGGPMLHLLSTDVS